MSQKNNRTSESRSKNAEKNAYQSMALAAAYASRNGISSPNANPYHPSFYPYSTPYGLPLNPACFLPGAATAFPLWSNAPALTNEYLLAMAGNLHGSRSAGFHSPIRYPSNGNEGLNETFEDMLRKISQMSNRASSNSTNTTSKAPTPKQPGNTRDSEDEQPCSSSSRKLVTDEATNHSKIKLSTLAHIASRVATENSQEPDTTTIHDQLNSDNHLRKRKFELEESNSIVSSTSDNFMKKAKIAEAEQVLKPNGKTGSTTKKVQQLLQTHETQRVGQKDDNNVASLLPKQLMESLGFKGVDPSLLNASAVAWAALSNQLLLAASLQQQKAMEDLNRATPAQKNNPVKTAENASKIQAGKSSASSAVSSLKNGNAKGHYGHEEKYCKNPDVDHGNQKKVVTVRQQLAMKRTGTVVNSTKKMNRSASEDVAALDLSVKTMSSPPIDAPLISFISPKINRPSSSGSNGKNSRSPPTTTKYSARTRIYSPPLFAKKIIARGITRPLPETDFVRLPLNNGWKRQTCVRTISSSGVRGDVIYYAPCGRQLGSYAEVLRYLVKTNAKNLGRHNFSFSCKVIVGEFLQVKSENGKSRITQLSEKEMKAIIAKLQSSKTKIHKETEKFVHNLTTPRRSSISKPVTVVKGRLPPPKKRGRPSTSGLNYQQTALQKANAAAKKAGRGKAQYETEDSRVDSMAEENIPQVEWNDNEIQQDESGHSISKTRSNRSAKNYMKLPEAGNVLAKQKVITESRDYALKARLLRLPVDDLEIRTSTALKKLQRVENLQLDGQSFADLLMVVEFVRNFGQVLNISEEDVPNVNNLHSGLFNDRLHFKSTLKLVKILLTLVLEYPGLPTGPKSRTAAGQSCRDLVANYDNMSELMRIFLESRGSQGKLLSIPLERNCFEALKPSDKISILAFMCNELLYCRNVVREVESNVDIVNKLKSDRWLLEGKKKHLKAIRDCKCRPNDKAATQLQTANDGIDVKIDDESSTVLSDVEKLADNDAIDDDETLDKVKQKVVAESESLANEAKNMSVEEVDGEMKAFDLNIENLNSKIQEASCKVRSLPLGQDRNFRLYWSLPASSSGILVETVESQLTRNNYSSIPKQVCNAVLQETMISEVGQCLQFIVDGVCATLNCGGAYSPISSATEKAVDSTLITTDERTGWFKIGEKIELDELEQNLNCRGIREKHLHKVLSFKFDRPTKERWFANDRKDLLPTKLTYCSDFALQVTANLAKMHKVYRKICDLEEKVFIASVHSKTWKQPDAHVELQCQKITRVKTNKKSRPVRRRKTNDLHKSISTFMKYESTSTSSDSSDDSSFEFDFEIDEPDSTFDSQSRVISDAAKLRDYEQLVVILRSRLLALEQNIEKRYLHPSFQTRSKLVNGSIDGNHSGGDRIVLSNSNDSFGCESDCNLPQPKRRWLNAVSTACAPTQFSLCIDMLDQNICWERSAMKAMCQICRRGDNDSKLLLCDGCDLGYHTYCFKPEMVNIPEYDWFCPECVSEATRRPCCLLCCRQTSRPMVTCYECDRTFHCDCASNSESDAVLPDQKNWVCDGCNTAAEKVDKVAKNAQKQLKKKSESKPMKILSEKKNIRCSDKVLSNDVKSCHATTRSKRAKHGPSPAHSKNSVVNPVESLNFIEICSILLAELNAHDDVWPFRNPVDVNDCPLYREVIKKPMDLGLIQQKLTARKYKNANDFVSDLKLMFNNCKIFNEDDSPIGKAGHNLKKIFNKRWKELNETSSE